MEWNWQIRTKKLILILGFRATGSKTRLRSYFLFTLSTNFMSQDQAPPMLQPLYFKKCYFCLILIHFSKYKASNTTLRLVIILSHSSTVYLISMSFHLSSFATLAWVVLPFSIKAIPTWLTSSSINDKENCLKISNLWSFEERGREHQGKDNPGRFDPVRSALQIIMIIFCSLLMCQSSSRDKRSLFYGPLLVAICPCLCSRWFLHSKL